MTRTSSKALYLFYLLSACLLFISTAYAQVESPDERYLFKEDSDSFRDKQSKQVEEIVKQDPVKDQDLDVRAPTVQYDKEGEVLNASGGVVVSRGGIQVQSDQASVNMQSKEGTFEGGVILSSPEGVLQADKADFNIDNETGDFENARFTLDDGAYDVASSQVSKLSETKYSLYRSRFTTCHCEDDTSPWWIQSSRANITEESYAHTYNTIFKLYGIPLFYTPYFAFPVKTERQSGLLVPEFGYSSRDGFQFKIPLFWAVDDHTDMTFTPHIETRTRRGMGVDFRKAFSKYNNVESRLIYSDESPRDGDLRGTVVSNLTDPEFDEDRFGGFYKHYWNTPPDSDLSLGMIADIHLVSDDLFLREIEDEDIARRTARYTTSRLVFRSPVTDYGSLELAGEYNQSLLTDDDLVFQRLPELTLNMLRSFRPFGFNPLGLKTVTSGKLQVTQFQRKEGFDGTRMDINPGVKIPFHYKNYFNSEFSVGLHHTIYDLSNNMQPNSTTELDATNDRTVYTIEQKLSTAVERVFDLDEGNWLTYLTMLGSENQSDKLTRLKHTVEPIVSYKYIPDVEQDDLPLFDSLDRIRERSLVTYGVRTSLFGRFVPTLPSQEEITELTPRLEDLPMLDFSTPLSDLDDTDRFGMLTGNVSQQRRSIRELASLYIRQSYDIIEARENNNPDADEFTDIGTTLGIYPSKSFALKFDSNFDQEDRTFSSWAVGTHFKDDRGDILRARYNFIDNSISQLEASAELKIVDKIKLAGYARYDDQKHEFIEGKGALRFVSGCNCWYFDLGYRDRTNPDKSEFMLNFTLVGLGDIAQDISFGDDQNQ